MRQPTAMESYAMKQGASSYNMQQEFGVHWDTYKRWREEQSAADTEEAARMVEFLAGEDKSEEPEEPDEWGQLWEAATEHIKAKQAVDEDTTLIQRDWGNAPVGLLLTSDWHIGSDWCNMDQLLDDARHIGEFRDRNPGALHLAHLGDPIDGFLTAGATAGGLYEEVETRLDRQEGLFLWAAKQAGLDWLVLLYGCHEAWTLTKSGRDPITPLAKVLGAENGGYGVVLEAEVGNQLYRVVMRHKAQRESATNTSNAQRVIDDDMAIDVEGHRADAICLSHLHCNDLHVRRKAGRRVIYTRSGAYKGGDCFARGGGYTQHKGADHGSPLLIFYPDTHDIMAIDGHHWRTGLEVLQRARN